MEKWDTAAKIVGILATVIGAAVGGARWLYVKWLKLFLEEKRIEKIKAQEFRVQLSEMPQQLRDIKKQLFPNGGSSIVDMLARLNVKVGNIELRLDSSEERQKFMLNMQGVPFWFSDSKGEAAYISPALARLVERSESELLGKSWISCIAKEDVDRVVEEWQQSLKDLRTFDEFYQFESNGKKIKVHGVAFHTVNKITKEYLGSYGTLSTHII